MFLALGGLLFLLYLGFMSFISRIPPPLVQPTQGEVWPKPYRQVFLNYYYLVKPQTFRFRVVAQKCELLEKALERYLRIIDKTKISRNLFIKQNDETETKIFLGYLDTLNVYLKEACDNITLPPYSMEEQYILDVTTNKSNTTLSAASIWGIIRGLETFSQLLYPVENEMLRIECTEVIDLPRFPHRGLLVDTARHFIPMIKIYKILDAMSYNKLNVFHWHITDDESFPYQSIKYPELSKKGAFSRILVYSQENVRDIINYAAARGIRVLVEFDTPGHSKSWGKAIPTLLTQCYKLGKLSDELGPIDPTKNSTYTFLENFFEEVATVFPEDYLHIGADEVRYDCWKSNPTIQMFMKNNKLLLHTHLEDYYIQKLLKIVHSLSKKPIVWEEAFVDGMTLPTSTTVQIWKDSALGGWRSTARSATAAGHLVLISACWYLDHLTSGGDWGKFYNCEPLSFLGNQLQTSMVLGGEACMWTEVVNEYNIESRIWPRASATAEKLWSKRDADTYRKATHRLEEHACRMIKRGIKAQPPNSAGFCI
ncbi:hypothetical protein ILUMI_27397 [Ignelater luminosus]|uniref:Beta-hexosaminidase n=1 Tax=Ignelater luminosus TaxID=2038154 RepID=A0A8K0C810_IGNLU|nr:hypothetical protein ILUMI_27397 [Ignelater luminosus]